MLCLYCAFVHVCYVQCHPQVDQHKQTKILKSWKRKENCSVWAESNNHDSTHVEQLTQIAHCSEGNLHDSVIVCENYIS